SLRRAEKTSGEDCRVPVTRSYRRSSRVCEWPRCCSASTLGHCRFLGEIVKAEVTRRAAFDEVLASRLVPRPSPAHVLRELRDGPAPVNTTSYEEIPLLPEAGTGSTSSATYILGLGAHLQRSPAPTNISTTNRNSNATTPSTAMS